MVACAPCLVAAASNPVTAPLVLPMAAVSVIGYYKYKSPRKGSKKRQKNIKKSKSKRSNISKGSKKVRKKKIPLKKTKPKKTIKRKTKRKR